MNLFNKKIELNEDNLTSVIKQELLTKLEFGVRSWLYDSDVEEIVKKSKELYGMLELESLEIHIEARQFQVGPRFISRRQMDTMRASLLSSVNNDVRRAFHELTDFIHNYGSGIDQPISITEKFCMKQMLDCILYMKTT